MKTILSQNQTVNDFFTGSELALTTYMLAHYGTLVLLEGFDYTQPAVSEYIGLLYGENWASIINAMTTEYKPLDNYNMTEHIENGGNDINSDKRSITTTNTGTIGTENNLVSDNTDTSATTFDSSALVPTSGTSSTGNSNSTTTNNLTTEVQHTGDIDVIYGHTIDTTRTGNIGVTTSQQMLQSEIDLRTKNYMFIIIAKNIIDVVGAGYYDTN